LTVVTVHFHGYNVGKTRVTGCLQRGISIGVKKNTQAYIDLSFFRTYYIGSV